MQIFVNKFLNWLQRNYILTFSINMFTAVGIDLGTTNSCVGVWRNGRVEIVANREGDRITPSYVAYTDSAPSGILVGKAAIEQMQQNSKNTIFDCKRMLGKCVNDENMLEISRYWNFHVVSDSENRPLIQVDVPGQGTQNFRPHQISAEVLNELKTIAKTSLDRNVTEAVIAVPANFLDRQKHETVLAAEKAGIRVLQLITEPSAAAIAYGFDKGKFDGYTILVYDFGGGTFDVTVIQAKNSSFDQLQTLGDNVGGRDIDATLVKFCAEKIKKLFGFDPLFSNDSQRQKLHTYCIELKERLSVKCAIRFEMHKIDPAYRGKGFELKREDFERCCAELLQKTIDLTRQAVQTSVDPNRNKMLALSQIDVVLLVGGSTRIPKIHSLLSELFPEKVLSQTIDPDEAVAYGATIYAANLLTKGNEDGLRFRIREIVPLSIGIELHDGRLKKIIPRGTQIPCEPISEEFFTSVNNQKGMSLEVYHGEEAFVNSRFHIGSLEIQDKFRGPACHDGITVKMNVDDNGLLNVEVLAKGSPVQTTFSYNRPKIELVEQVIRSASERMDENNRRERLLDAKNDLKRILNETIYKAKQLKGLKRKYLIDLCKDEQRWMDKHLDKASEKEIRSHNKKFCHELEHNFVD